ncbi:unnamed protein product [Lactuca saligna]|uniref:Uncharacterized protein n=1 Tax=Lactuca saligna TaxID=75948 RepID=A0AA35Z3D0_LACSI|nr:unnamed protein product [Lactuca saligna]
MLAPISASSNVLQKYRKHPSSGPRELTPAMVRSIDEVDKPAKRGKKSETHKEAQVSKPTKGKTPKKRKSDKAVTSPPQPKKLKKLARRLILQSSSDSDSKYVPPQHKIAPPSEFERESSEDEASGRATRQAIKATNASLHANVNDLLTQLEVELAVENGIMGELNDLKSMSSMI